MLQIRKRMLPLWLVVWLVWSPVQQLRAQTDVLVNLGPIDGLDLDPDNLLGYQIQSNLTRTTNALVKGTIRYRNSDLRISYSFQVKLRPGINAVDRNLVRPEFTYSTAALRELFEVYRRLPQGIYEYCVSVQPDYHMGERPAGDLFEECLYRKSEDIFLINLIDPENNAKIYEYNPMLSWVVNYPFAAALTYRIRVAEVKDGQNNVAAITRNNPVYEEKNLVQSSQLYPVYAKPLEKFQPYAWTVDAYYKGLLLGGAEPWRFTIIEDSLFDGAPKDVSHIDIRREKGSHDLYAPGILKLKYVLEDRRSDSLSLRLTDSKGKEIKFKSNVWMASYGDNRTEINFHEEKPLKHMQAYVLHIASRTGMVYKVAFIYVNPDFIK